MKELYARFERIEFMARRGQITIGEANRLMMEAIEAASEDYLLRDGKQIDSMKAYHKMYIILSKLTRE